NCALTNRLPYEQLINACLFPYQHHRRLFRSSNLFEETPHRLILPHWNLSGELHQVARKNKLAVFDEVACVVGTEGSIKFQSIGELVNFKALRKFVADR